MWKIVYKKSIQKDLELKNSKGPIHSGPSLKSKKIAEA